MVYVVHDKYIYLDNDCDIKKDLPEKAGLYHYFFIGINNASVQRLPWRHNGSIPDLHRD